MPNGIWAIIQLLGQFWLYWHMDTLTDLETLRNIIPFRCVLLWLDVLMLIIWFFVLHTCACNKMPYNFITKQNRTNCMHPGFVGGTTSLFKGLQVGRIEIRRKLYSTRRRQLWWPLLWSGKEVSQGQAKDFGRLGTLWKGGNSKLWPTHFFSFCSGDSFSPFI